MKTIGMALVFLVGLFVIGCSQRPQQPSQAEQILKGEHKLRKMLERSETDSRISGGFFLIVGGLNGTINTSISMKFAWEMNDGTYAISSLPLEKIRVKLDEKVTTPTIKFRWQRWHNSFGTAQVQKLMDSYILYAVLTVRESDWPVQVSLPLNR